MTWCTSPARKPSPWCCLEVSHCWVISGFSDGVYSEGDDLGSLLWKWLCWCLVGQSKFYRTRSSLVTVLAQIRKKSSCGGSLQSSQLVLVGLHKRFRPTKRNVYQVGPSVGGLLLCSTRAMKSGRNSQLWLHSLVYSGAFCRLRSCKYPWANMWSWLEESVPHRVH